MKTLKKQLGLIIVMLVMIPFFISVGYLEDELQIPKTITAGVTFVIFLTVLLVARWKKIHAIRRETLILFIGGITLLTVANSINHFIFNFFTHSPVFVMAAMAPSVLYYAIKSKDDESNT